MTPCSKRPPAFFLADDAERWCLASASVRNVGGEADRLGRYGLDRVSVVFPWPLLLMSNVMENR